VALAVAEVHRGIVCPQTGLWSNGQWSDEFQTSTVRTRDSRNVLRRGLRYVVVALALGGAENVS
jgi:hypothetical protein